MAKLQLTLDKTVFLVILKDDEIICLDKNENPSTPVLFASNVGHRRPPHFGMFQLLMAFLSETEINRILLRKPLTAITNKSITDEVSFKERLAMTRRTGFLLEEGEAFDGVSGVSAPIRDFAGKVIAAIGVRFISSSVDEAEKQTIIKEVVNTARDISELLGFSGGARNINATATDMEVR